MIEEFKNFISMFLLLATELTILFIGINYLVLVMQEYIPQAKIEKALSSNNKFSYLYSIILAVITPFCSCSTIPFLRGLIKAKAGFGPIMTFLFTSPLLNPIVVGLFIYAFGLPVAIIYSLIAIVVATLSSYVLQKLKFEKYIKDNSYIDNSCYTTTKEDISCCSNDENKASYCSTNDIKNSKEDNSCCSDEKVQIKYKNRWIKMLINSLKEYRSVLPYVIIGITLGAAIHGFVPTDFIAKYASKDNLFAVPFSAIVGIPLYVRAETLVPISTGLLEKGMSLGSVMALIIGSAGASLTEVLILRSIFKINIIIAFLLVVLGMAVISGYIFNFFF